MPGFPGRAIPLRDGRTVFLREIRPEDLPAWEKMILACSPETLWRRFECRSTQTVLARKDDLFDESSVVIVAELEGRLVGEARLCLLPGRAAEFCVLVADPWQGLGLGSALIDFALELAKSLGLQKILTEIVPENARIVDLLRRRGFQFSVEEDGLTHWGELTLPG